MITACHAANKPVSVVVSVLDGGVCRWVKEHSPQTTTVVRPVWPDNPPSQNGLMHFDLQWFNQQIEPIRAYLPWIDYVQLYNEKWPGNTAWGAPIEAVRDFEWACGREATRQGFHITLLNLAMGNMADDRCAPKEPNQFSIMRPMLDDMCRAGHVLCDHPYNAVATPYDPEPAFEYNAGRWLHWCELLPSLRVIGGEALVPEWKNASGQEARLQSPDQTVWQMRQFDRLINEAIRQGRIKADQFLGYAPFTGNPGDRWRNFNQEPVYPVQQAYLLE